MIRKIIQGEDGKQDRDLFCMIGPWATSREISKRLGMSIFSEKGDIWHLIIDKLGTLTGFALTHVYKTTKTAHVRYFYVLATAGKEQADLLTEVLLLVRNHKLESLYTYDRSTNVVWQKAGFTKTKKPRSSFYKWEKTFKELK